MALKVWARDGGKPRRECIIPALVKIRVISGSQTVLSFTKSTYRATVYLPTVQGVLVSCLSVSSSQSANPNSKLLSTPNRGLSYHFSIVSDVEEQHFRINSSDGCIYISNYKNLASFYNLTVTVTEGGNSGLRDTANVLIYTKELPEDSLKFDKETYWANVLENSTNPLNLLRIGVRGLPLNYPVEYSLLNYHEYFDMKSTSGVLRTTGKPFDWEKRDNFTLRVKVRYLRYF